MLQSSRSMPHRAVFLDLNGTLVMPIKVQRLQELVPVADAAAAVARLTDAGFICPVVTIQSRIAKGLFSMAEFVEWFESFAASLRIEGAELVGPYVCPHRFAEPCVCKKPNALLYAKAASDHRLDLHRSYVIGDSARDIEAATRFGGEAVLVRTGWAQSDDEVSRASPCASHVAAALSDAVDWITSR